MKYIITVGLIILTAVLSSCSASTTHERISDIGRIENDLMVITKTKESRNHLNTETLNFVAQYIYDELSKNCDTVFYQIYYVNGREYKNVVGRIGTHKKDKIVIGAHYDVAGNQEGADDNASGVVGLLELSRIIPTRDIGYQIEMVAYTLEEPPYFKTEQMGSFIHAKSLYDNNEQIAGMICLEMIGYFNDNKRSQDYPLGFLKMFYGNRGDYITVVQRFENGKFGRRVNRKMKREDIIKTKSFKAPASLPGVDFSDHLNYWKFDYSAVMITNTAFYRNKNYHRNTDKMETLDLNRMSLVIDEVFLTLTQLI